MSQCEIAARIATAPEQLRNQSLVACDGLSRARFPRFRDCNFRSRAAGTADGATALHNDEGTNTRAGSRGPLAQLDRAADF